MTDREVAFEVETAKALGAIKTSVEKIEEHLRVLNGSMATHRDKIAQGQMELATHASHCPMLVEVADIRQDLAVMEGRRRLNKVWQSAIWAAAGAILALAGKLLAPLVARLLG